MNPLLQDLRYALRMLRKSPGFTVIAILTLAFGIGANTAIFSFISAWLIHPMPYAEGERLAVIQGLNVKRGFTSDVSSVADFYDWQHDNTSFSQLTPWMNWTYNLTGDGPPERVESSRTGWNFFDTLGVKPLLGRTFVPQDDQPGASRVAVISQGLWKGRYASDSQIIGRRIALDGETFAVIGVMPANFQLPMTGESNLWTPLAFTEKERAVRAGASLYAMGRLKPGVSLEQAQAEIVTICARLEKAYPKTNAGWSAHLRTLKDAIGEQQGTRQLMILMFGVGFVLLIACANVTNLSLARATGRSKEFAVRAALGAGRGRLVRQLLTETLLLFGAGGASGLLVAVWMLAWIESGIPARSRGYITNYGYVSLDWITLAFTLGLALAAGIVFGLAPALASTRLDLNRTLKDAAGQTGGPRRGAWLRNAFAGGEFALALVVVICSALLVQDFLHEMTSDRGFQPNNMVITSVDLPATKYKTPAEFRNFYDLAIERVAALPQVAAAGGAESAPSHECCNSTAFSIVGRPEPEPGQSPGARYAPVTPSYLPAMRIPLLRGRNFTSGDSPDAPRVVIISDVLERQFFPGKDAIGEKLHFQIDEGGPQPVDATVVGVVPTVRDYPGDRPRPQMYVPFAQFSAAHMEIVARAADGAASGEASLAAAIRDTIWSIDPDQPVGKVESYQQAILDHEGGYPIMSELMAGFSVLAMLLGMIGIYGVVANSVAQQTHEIGIRMALGAQPGQILRRTLGGGLLIAGIGIAAGFLIALVTSRGLAFMLTGIGPNDPATFAVSSLLLAAAALAACYIPARRAMRVDPIVALRYE